MDPRGIRDHTRVNWWLKQTDIQWLGIEPIRDEPHWSVCFPMVIFFTCLIEKLNQMSFSDRRGAAEHRENCWGGFHGSSNNFLVTFSTRIIIMSQLLSHIPLFQVTSLCPCNLKDLHWKKNSQGGKMSKFQMFLPNFFLKKAFWRRRRCWGETSCHDRSSSWKQTHAVKSWDVVTLNPHPQENEAQSQQVWRRWMVFTAQRNKLCHT